MKHLNECLASIEVQNRKLLTHPDNLSMVPVAHVSINVVQDPFHEH